MLTFEKESRNNVIATVINLCLIAWQASLSCVLVAGSVYYLAALISGSYSAPV